MIESFCTDGVSTKEPTRRFVPGDGFVFTFEEAEEVDESEFLHPDVFLRFIRIHLFVFLSVVQIRRICLFVYFSSSSSSFIGGGGGGDGGLSEIFFFRSTRKA